MTGSLMRLTRTSMLETLGQGYIVTARAKGLTEFTVIVLSRIFFGARLSLLRLLFRTIKKSEAI